MKRGRGSFIKKRNLIILAWAEIIRYKNKSIEWDVLVDLLDWFCKKLDTYKELKPQKGESDVEYLRNQYYRNKKKSQIFNKFKTKEFFRFERSMGKTGILLFTYIYCVPIKWSLINSFNSLEYKKRISFYEDLLLKREELKNRDRSIDAYLFYVWKLCKNNSNLRPLIIFPDLSYL